MKSGKDYVHKNDRNKLLLFQIAKYLKEINTVGEFLTNYISKEGKLCAFPPSRKIRTFRKVL